MTLRHVTREDGVQIMIANRDRGRGSAVARTGHKRENNPNERAAGSSPAPSPTIQSFFVPGPLPGANDIIRKHWRVYSRLKVKWGQAIALVLLVYKIQPVRACAILYQWIEPTPVRGHIRDRDNIRFGAKFVNDALVSQGILLDDGPDGVVSLTDSFTYDGVTPGVQVTIEEVQP
jgi:hypothetical protein